MNLWTIMSPHAQVTFSCEDEEKGALFSAELIKVPGVKFKNGGWLVPDNALGIVAELQARLGVDTASAAWVRKPDAPKLWSEIEASLRRSGEVRDFVLDSFLLDYQKDAITFGWTKSGFHLWTSAGSGKTIMALIASLAVRGPIVVVTRGSVRLQFAREIERFLNLDAHVLRPTTMMRKKHLTLEQYLEKQRTKKQRPIVVLSWESLPLRLDELKAMRPNAVLFDEIHAGAKNSKRFEVIHLPDLPDKDTEVEAYQKALEEENALRASKKDSFLKETEDGRKLFVPRTNIASAAAELGRLVSKRIGLTATPIKDRVRDLWGQLDAVEPNAWGSATLWHTRHSDRKPGIYGGFDTTGSSNLDELNKRLEKVAFILGYADTHRSLPEKRRQSVYVPAEDQDRPSGGFAAEIKRAAKRGATAVLEARLAEAASRKRTAVLGMLEDHLYSKQKVVIFTGRIKDCQKLYEEAQKLAKKVGNGAQAWSIYGEVSAEARANIQDEYMAHPGPCVLVATGQSAGTGLNLQDTDAALFVMLPVTPDAIVQWEGRFSRRGGTRPVVIYYVIAEGTVDEHMAQLLLNKLPAVQKVVGDEELLGVDPVLAGRDPNQTPEQFAKSILDLIDIEDENQLLEEDD